MGKLTIGGLKATNQLFMTEYSIFLKEKAYLNVGNGKMRHTFKALDFLRSYKDFSEEKKGNPRSKQSGP